MVIDKSPGALMSIGEVSDHTGIPQHVLRYWEGRLPQLRPVKRAGGRRYYRPEDVAMIRDIQRLVDKEGFTLDGAARALRRGEGAGDTGTVMNAASGITADPQMLAGLRRVRDRLARALNAA
jgi:DNA-binding transcriptional MerR regulator